MNEYKLIATRTHSFFLFIYLNIDQMVFPVELDYSMP